MPIVKTSAGFIRGGVKKDINGREFYSFEGIRYGEPPTGSQRFRAPIPAKPWLGVKDALSQAPRCYSADIVDLKAKKIEIEFGGSEDCLFLNVFTPELPNDNYNLKPVMVFIHGGAYLIGSPHMYGPEVLLAEDVVLVTIQYRIGALGFLAIDEPELGVTGNAGQKDMVLALKWVQQNIKVFNGDPNNVTIFGESAGGAAVHYLVLSPLAKGLFHKAIMESGVSTINWAIGNPNNGIELAKHLGYTTTHEKNVLKFLQDMTTEELLKAQISMREVLQPSTLRLFAPVIENSTAEGAFLTQDPVEIIHSGKYNHVPLILGYCKDEAGCMIDFPEELGWKINVTAKESIVPFSFGLQIGSEGYEEVADKIMNFYAGVSDGSSKMGTDSSVREIIRSAKWHSKTNNEPVFLYRLSVPTKLAFITEGKSGIVAHGDDLGYLFQFSKTPKVHPGSIEDMTRQRIVKLFVNFARTGNPNAPKKNFLFPISWMPVENGKSALLDIGTTISMVTNPEKKRMEFWDGLYQEYDHEKYKANN